MFINSFPFKLLDKPLNNSTKKSQNVEQIMKNISKLELKDKHELHKRLKNMRNFNVDRERVEKQSEIAYFRNHSIESGYQSDKSNFSKMDDRYDVKIIIQGDSEFKPTSPDFEDLKKCFKTITDAFASSLIHEHHEDDFNVLSNTCHRG